MKIKFLSFIFLIIALSLFIYKNSHKLFSCTQISGGFYFDSNTGSMQANKEIFIENNSIFFEPLSSEKNCRQIILKDQYILPGLIDAHTHLLAADRQTVSNWKYALELSALRPTMSRIYIGEKNAKDMLLSGFTTVRDLGNSGNFLDVELQHRINQNITIGPDMVVSGPGLATLNTQINTHLNPHEYARFDHQTNLLNFLDTYKKKNTQWIKIYADNSNPNEIVDAKLIQKAVNLAHQSGFKVAVHSIYDWSTTNALASLPDSIEHFNAVPLPDTLLSDQKPFVVLTDFTLNVCQRSQVEKNCEQVIDNFKKRILWLKQNQFKLVFGSDAVLDFTHKFNNRGLAALSSLIGLEELGLTPLEIIQSATSNAASMLSLNTGKIATSQQADLVIYNENPLKNIKALLLPSMVFSNGELICKSASECAHD